MAATLLSGAAEAAALTGGTTPTSTNGAAVSMDTLLAAYLAAHPDLRTDPGFARDWVAATRCPEWTKLFNDEFRAGPYLKAAAAELAARREPAPQTYELRLERSMGRYDADKGEFGLHVLGVRDALPVLSPGFGGEGVTSSFRPGCAPTSGRYPVEFLVTFDDPQVTEGLPMAPDAASTFAAARTNQFGNRDNRVVADLTLRLTLGQPRSTDAGSAAKGVVVPVTAHVEDLVVEDGTAQHRVLYRLSPAKRQAGEAAAADRRAAEQAASAVPKADALKLLDQFQLERRGAVVGTEPLRVELDRLWSKDDKGWHMELRPSDTIRLGSTSMHFDNAPEVAAAQPPPELAASLAGSAARTVTLTYLPVGALEDPLKGGPFLMGHVVSLDTASEFADGRKSFVSLPMPSPAKPWALATDDRQAGAFDILGLRVGATPVEVIARAKAELGQSLKLDTTTGEVRSAFEDCDFDIVQGRVPPPTRRCLQARFVKTADGIWSLVKLRLIQAVPSNQAEATGKALVEKYGKPDLVRSFDPARRLSDPEGEAPPRGDAIGWGVRISDRRVETDHVPFPLHVLEAIVRTGGGLSILTLTVTDAAAITGSAITANPGVIAPAPKF